MIYYTNPYSGDTMTESDFNSVKHQCGYFVESMNNSEERCLYADALASKSYFKWSE